VNFSPFGELAVFNHPEEFFTIYKKIVFPLNLSWTGLTGSEADRVP
jgi:hypothetical protein